MAALAFLASLAAVGFTSYVERVLLPTLRGGEIVVLDNLACHKHPRVRELVESVGAEVWYLPPYSPDFNPIEEMWSKIKQVLRTLAARTFEGLIKAIGIAIQQVTPQNLIGWFTHGGYTS
jgi:transposase